MTLSDSPKTKMGNLLLLFIDPPILSPALAPAFLPFFLFLSNLGAADV
jgi:hypothetical protein